MRPRTTALPFACLAALCILGTSTLAGCSSAPTGNAGASTAPSTTVATVDTTATSRPRTPVTAGDLRVGQAATLGDLRVTVTAAGRQGTYKGKPLFVVTATFENEGSQPIPFDQSDWSLELADGVGGADKPLTREGGLGTGVVAPGTAKTGTVSFVCPREISKVIFTPSSGVAGDRAVWIFY
jgi:hypothetical protein